jgi:hypothetical protein
MSYDKRLRATAIEGHFGDDFFDPNDPNAVFQNWNTQSPSLRTGTQINVAPIATQWVESLGFSVYGEGGSRRFDKRKVTVVGADASSVVAAYTGSHTIADCDNLIVNYDKWVKQLGDQFTGLMSAWKGKDPTTEAAWGVDYNGLVTRWAQAKTAVDNARSSILPNSVTGAEDVYQGLVHALHQGGEGAPPIAGDFNDLRDRLNAYASSVGVAIHLDTPAQPVAGPTDPGWSGPGGLGAWKAPKLDVDKALLAAGIVLGVIVAVNVVPPMLGAYGAYRAGREADRRATRIVRNGW